MSVLPDYLAPGLRVVFCGTAVGETSAKRGHYYAGPGNEFWPLLYESGLVSEPLTPQDDARIVEFGIGLTDLAKRIAASSDAGWAPTTTSMDSSTGSSSRRRRGLPSTVKPRPASHRTRSVTVAS